MSKRWVYWLLGAVALALVVATVTLHLRETSARGPDTSRGLLGATLSAKMAVLGDAAIAGAPADPATSAYGDLVRDALDKACAEGAPPDRARALRRKAIWCDYKGASCAGEALGTLARIAPKDRLPAPADEADVLREVLGGAKIAPERVAPLAARLGEIRLGWFDHLLRERLYRHAGDVAAAERELADARSTAITSMAAAFGFLGLLAIGGVAWLIAMFHPATRRVWTALAERSREPGTLTDGEAARLLVVFATFLGVALLLGPATRFVGLPRPSTPLGSALQALGGEATVAVVVFLVHRALALGKGAPPPALGFEGSRLKRALGRGALVYLLLLPAIFLVLIPLGALFDRLGIPTQSHPIVDHLNAAASSPAAIAVWLLVAAVAAPLLEEAVFRGALQRALRHRFGGRWAIVLSSLMFAVIHPQVGLGLVAILVIGLVLALLREHERSLWPSVVVHALNNGVTLALALGMLSG